MNALEWRAVGSEIHGYLKGYYEMTLFVIREERPFWWRLMGAFVPDAFERTPGTAKIANLKDEAERLMAQWVEAYTAVQKGGARP